MLASLKQLSQSVFSRYPVITIFLITTIASKLNDIETPEENTSYWFNIIPLGSIVNGKAV
jgi:hypothetical protein